MSTYRNVYCPFCHKALTIHERSEFFSYNRYIGLKYERCPYCKNIYSTGKKLYNEMNEQERVDLFKFYLFNIVSAMVTLWAVIFVTIMIIDYAISNISTFSFDENGNFIMVLMCLCLIPSMILGFLAAKNNYENVKKITIDNFKEYVDEEVITLNKIKSKIVESKEDNQLTELIDKLEQEKEKQ